jgi:hypothetical protein
MLMPPNANIPDKWVDEADGKKIITVPSWSAEGGIYKVEMDKQTREIRCNCPGFKFRNDCHHVDYLINFCRKPQNPHKIGVQQTSLEAYKQAKVTMNDHQAIVLATIDVHGPISNKQISMILGWPINSVTPRVLELRTMEKVKFAGQRQDLKTGRHEMMWDAVG